jgi:hypothetical protein
MAMQLIANSTKKNVLGVGLGGATTNIYSIFDGRFVRSVSANLGMSYSICNVMKEAGIPNIMRWIPFEIDVDEIRNTLRNKMIRPTTIPQTLRELIIEHATAREALRLGLEHHKSIATTLRGARGESAFARGITSQEMQVTYIDMMKMDIVAGTGGLLSHAPKREQSMLIMNDAFQSEGVTMFFQDSVFMMPHLGVVSTVYPEAAWSVFDKDCLVRNGTVVAARGVGSLGEKVMDVELVLPGDETVKESLCYGDLKKILLPERQTAEIAVKPAKNFDVGSGPGKEYSGTIEGGVVGVVLDARGRPLSLPGNREDAKKLLLGWWNAMGLYQDNFMELVQK